MCICRWLLDAARPRLPYRPVLSLPPPAVSRLLVEGTGGPSARSRYATPPPPQGPSAHFYWGGGVASKSEGTAPPWWRAPSFHKTHTNVKKWTKTE